MSPIENTNRKEIRIKSESARIKEIVFLNGENGATAKSVYQYVNLVRSNNFVDGSVVPNLDRIGNKPRLKVSFSKPGAHQFTVKCRAHTENSRYTDGEISRNPNFQYQREQKSYTTGSDGSLILPLDDFYISPAGKDKYVFEASDTGGQKVSTGNLEVQRLIYYVELKMRSLKSCAKSLSTAEKEYEKYNIKLIKLPTVEMDYIPNIGRDETEIFIKKVDKAYASSKAIEKQPYVIAIAYTSHLAIKKPRLKILERSVKVGPGCAPVLIDIFDEAASSDSLAYFYLWQGLDSGNWFISARYIKQGGTRADIINIPQEKCKAVPENPGSLKARQVSIDVSSLPDSTGTIELVVNAVDYMRAGIAYEGLNLICVCTEAWWATIDEREQNQVIVHELGHKIGMVPNGTGKGPDKPSTWYDNTKGHVGNHCFNGLPPNLENYAGEFANHLIKCVMYGASSDKSNFCLNCAPLVCKADLSGGWEPL